MVSDLPRFERLAKPERRLGRNRFLHESAKEEEADL
jgi:hypothetical protein